MAALVSHEREGRDVVIAYHSIFAAYGFWLPNDPRGSWSDFVRRWELLQFGPASKTDTRRSVAHVGHDSALRRQAKEALIHPPVCFTGRQALSIARGFARAAEESGYRVRACSILPEHVHTVIARHERAVGRIVGHLKTRAAQQLRTDGLHPFIEHVREDGTLPSPWARKAWHVFLNTPEDLRRAIQYVQRNPVREGKRPQRWSFVTPIAMP